MEAAILLGILATVGLSASFFGDLQDADDNDDSDSDDRASEIEAEELHFEDAESTAIDGIDNLASGEAEVVTTDNVDDFDAGSLFGGVVEPTGNVVETIPEDQVDDAAEDQPEAIFDDKQDDVAIAGNGIISTGTYPIYPTPEDGVTEPEENPADAAEDNPGNLDPQHSNVETGGVANSDSMGGGLYVGGEGDDDIIGSGGADLVFGQAGADTIDGSAGDDRIYGIWDGNDDHLIEEKDVADPDVIIGGDGNDDIHLGSGDVATGEAGNDRFFTGTWVDPSDAPVVFDLEADEVVVVSVPVGASASTSITLIGDAESDNTFVQANGETVAVIAAGEGLVTEEQIILFENPNFAKSADTDTGADKRLAMPPTDQFA